MSTDRSAMAQTRRLYRSRTDRKQDSSARASRPWSWRVWVVVAVRAARTCCLEMAGVGMRPC
jgi:hypothetical protein